MIFNTLLLYKGGRRDGYTYLFTQMAVVLTSIIVMDFIILYRTVQTTLDLSLFRSLAREQ